MSVIVQSYLKRAVLSSKKKKISKIVSIDFLQLMQQTAQIPQLTRIFTVFTVVNWISVHGQSKNQLYYHLNGTWIN